MHLFHRRHTSLSPVNPQSISLALIKVLFGTSRKVFNLLKQRLPVGSTWTVISPTCGGKKRIISNFIVKVKSKSPHDMPVQAQLKGGGAAPAARNLGARTRCVALHHRQRPANHCTGGWASLRACLEG